MNKTLFGALAAICLVISGCASKGETTSGAGPRGGSDSHGSSGPGTGSTGRTGASGVRENILYFAYDSDEMDADLLPIVQQWADYMAAHPKAKVRLEGHADERGTPEYNVALGERRAKAVRVALIKRGVKAEQISIVSFGEERPAAAGHDESAWQKNRRVELVD